MGLKDFTPGADKGAGDRGGAKEKGPVADKRRFGNFLAQVPPEFQSTVIRIAKDNHQYFKEKFPTFEEFQDAVAESWTEKRKGFEEEARKQGFTPIEPGTKPSALNECTLAYLTESGSFVVLGPGAFEKNIPNAPGAAFSYVKIPFRKNPGTPEDAVQGSGVFVNATPKRGERINIKGITPRYEGDVGGLYTSPVINQMIKRTSKAEALPVLEGVKAGISRRFEEINQEVGIVLARPKK